MSGFINSGERYPLKLDAVIDAFDNLFVDGTSVEEAGSKQLPRGFNRCDFPNKASMVLKRNSLHVIHDAGDVYVPKIMSYGPQFKDCKAFIDENTNSRVILSADPDAIAKARREGFKELSIIACSTAADIPPKQPPPANAHAARDAVTIGVGAHVASAELPLTIERGIPKYKQSSTITLYQTIIQQFEQSIDYGDGTIGAPLRKWTLDERKGRGRKNDSFVAKLYQYYYLKKIKGCVDGTEIPATVHIKTDIMKKAVLEATKEERAVNKEDDFWYKKCIETYEQSINGIQMDV